MNTPKRSGAKTQAERFLEAAEKAGVDKSGRKFAAAMKKVAKAKGERKPTK
jgi:hypothetical protein